MIGPLPGNCSCFLPAPEWYTCASWYVACVVVMLDFSYARLSCCAARVPGCLLSTVPVSVECTILFIRGSYGSFLTTVALRMVVVFSFWLCVVSFSSMFSMICSVSLSRFLFAVIIVIHVNYLFQKWLISYSAAGGTVSVGCIACIDVSVCGALYSFSRSMLRSLCRMAAVFLRHDHCDPLATVDLSMSTPNVIIAFAIIFTGCCGSPLYCGPYQANICKPGAMLLSGWRMIFL